MTCFSSELRQVYSWPRDLVSPVCPGSSLGFPNPNLERGRNVLKQDSSPVADKDLTLKTMTYMTESLHRHLASQFGKDTLRLVREREISASAFTWMSGSKVKLCAPEMIMSYTNTVNSHPRP